MVLMHNLECSANLVLFVDTHSALHQVNTARMTMGKPARRSYHQDCNKLHDIRLIPDRCACVC